MLTLIQTEENNRLNVAFEENAFETNPKLDGYVTKVDGLWFGFNMQNQPRSVGFENPVDAARLVIENYEDKAAASLARSIERMEASIVGLDPSNLLVRAKLRMLDGMKARLEARDFP